MGKLKHGKRHTRIYRIYSHMIARCNCITDFAYKDYGGRGITVCDEWKNDFMNFYNWSVENGYSEELTIDRVDNNKGYSPSNCKWATQKEQSNNRRSNVVLTIDGVTKNMKQWCDEKNLNYKVIMDRVYSGWDKIDAISVPIRKIKIDKECLK